MVTWSSEAAGVHAIEDFPDRGRILGNRAQGRIQERVLSGRDVRHGGCLGSAQPPRLEPDTRAWTATQITPLPRLSELLSKLAYQVPDEEDSNSDHAPATLIRAICVYVSARPDCTRIPT